jgi:flotillin
MTLFFFLLFVIFALFVGIITWRMLYRVPAADEALVITGAGAHPTREFRAKLEAERAARAQLSDVADDTAKAVMIVDPVELDPEFKIVVGKGVVLRPGQRMVRMSLASESAAISIANVPTVQGMTIGVDAVVIYKVGDNPSMIARAARRFSSNKGWTDMVKDVLEGHLRAVVGTMSLKDIWQNREQLASTVSEACGHDLSRLGLHVDSFGIKHIDDASGYIDNIAAEEKATAERDAKIARANAAREAAEAEAKAEALTSEAQAASAIRQAEVRAEAERAAATAAQSGPLAEAKARQSVIEEETRNAELSAKLKEQELQASVYKEADAQKYRTVKEAEAGRDSAIARADAQAAATQRAAEADASATRLAAQAEADSTRMRAEAEQARGVAEADVVRQAGLAEAEVRREQGLAQAQVIRSTGLAEAEAVQAQGDALAANQEPMIKKAIVDNLPLIVAANSEAYSRVGTLTVLDGMGGIGTGLQQTMATALAFVPQVLGAVRGDDGSGWGDDGGRAVRPPAPGGSGGGGAGVGGGSGDDRPQVAPASGSGPITARTGSTPPRSGSSDARSSDRPSSAPTRERGEAVSRAAASLGSTAVADFEEVADEAIDAGSKLMDRGVDRLAGGLDAAEGLVERAEHVADRVDRIRGRFRR